MNHIRRWHCDSNSVCADNAVAFKVLCCQLGKLAARCAQPRREWLDSQAPTGRLPKGLASYGPSNLPKQKRQREKKGHQVGSFDYRSTTARHCLTNRQTKAVLFVYPNSLIFSF